MALFRGKPGDPGDAASGTYLACRSGSRTDGLVGALAGVDVADAASIPKLET